MSAQQPGAGGQVIDLADTVRSAVERVDAAGVVVRP
jgi:hypothetical protein